MTNGTIRTWGRNRQGVCGNGATADIFSPFTPTVNAVNTAVKVLSVGSQDASTNYVMLSNGRVLACGYNGYGQKGIGTNAQNNTFDYILHDLNTAKFIDWSPWCDISSGTGLTLLTDTGQLYAVGYTEWGCGGVVVDSTYSYVPMQSHII